MMETYYQLTNHDSVTYFAQLIEQKENSPDASTREAAKAKLQQIKDKRDEPAVKK